VATTTAQDAGTVAEKEGDSVASPQENYVNPATTTTDNNDNNNSNTSSSDNNDNTPQKRSYDPAAVQKRKEAKKALYLAKLTKAGKYNPSNPRAPDPERWLPMNQRSYSKRSKKKSGPGGKYSGAQGAGGGGAKDADRLDAAKRAAEGKEKKENSTKHLEVVMDKKSRGRFRKSKK